MAKRASDTSWIELQDGVEFHAVHVRQLADAAVEAAARQARAVGAAGCFVWPPFDSGASCSNLVEPDDDSRVLDVENVAVLTYGGFLATLPAPRKSFALPRLGNERFLNLYVRAYEGGNGECEALWEKAPSRDPRSVPLAEWCLTRREFIVLPFPHTIGAMHQTAVAYSEIQAAVDELTAGLVNAGPIEFGRLHLKLAQANELGDLLGCLSRVRNGRPSTPTAALLPDLGTLASEILSWFQFLRAKADVRAAENAQPEPIGRARLRALKADGLPEYTRALASSPGTGRELIEWLNSIARSIEGLCRTLAGETDEEPLVPIETFVPDPWPAGMGYIYSLKGRGQELALRCELTTAAEPEMMWGIGPPGSLPALTPVLLGQAEPGRFDVLLGPVAIAEGDRLVVVVDSSDAALRAYAVTP